MIALLAYDILFMLTYLSVSYALCLHGSYTLNLTLIDEMAKGIQSLSFQLPLSNIATLYGGKFSDKEGLWVADCFMYIFIFDTLSFWIHYLFHKIPFLYNTIHKEHHNTIYVTPFSSTILATPEHIFIGIVPTLVPLYIIHMNILSWTLSNACIFIFGILIHSNSDSPTDLIMLGSYEHGMHHIYKNTHLGFMNPLWDYMMGTGTHPISKNRLRKTLVRS
jgi:sterol desaturase/sphingolipid hydroxylase (fatty acid hydroxylase superfamily)